MLANADDRYKCFSMDGFLRSFQGMRHTAVDGEDDPIAVIQLMAGLSRDVVEAGNHLVVDAVAMPDAIAIWLDCLEPVKPYLVHVGAPALVLDERERARGDRAIGMAAEQALPILRAARYDHYVDTSLLSPDEAAADILIRSETQRFLQLRERHVCPQW